MSTPSTTPIHPPDLCRHARLRATQRYHLDLTDRDVRRVLKRIRSGPPYAVRLRRDPKRRRRVWVAIRWKDEWLLAVWDERRDYLVTFLPRCRVEEFGERIERACGAATITSSSPSVSAPTRSREAC